MNFHIKHTRNTQKCPPTESKHGNRWCNALIASVALFLFLTPEHTSVIMQPASTGDIQLDNSHKKKKKKKLALNSDAEENTQLTNGTSE